MTAILTAPPRKKNIAGDGPSGRPSLLDPFLAGDPWMATCGLPGLLVLDVRNSPIALQPGTPLEQASLNSWIFRLRTTPPRGWPRE